MPIFGDKSRLTIRARLIWLTVGLVVPLVLVGFYNLWSAWQLSQKQLNESVERQAEFAATAFEQWLAAQQQTLLTIQDLTQNNQSPLTLKDYLNSIVKTRPHWLDVQIVSSTGEVKLSQSTKDRPLPVISLETLKQEVFLKKTLVVFTEQYEDEKLRLLSLALPLAGDDFVVARIDGTSASEIFEQLELPEDNIVAVFDGSNRLLYRSHVTPEQMAFYVTNTPMLSALEGKHTTSTTVESPYDKIERVYGLARVEVANCIVAVGVPSERLYQPVQLQFWNQLVFGLLITVLAIFAASLIARSIVMPMRSLGQAARDFGAGNLKSRTDISQNSVINELGQTFNQMAEQIAEREERLKELDRLKSEFVSSVSHELRTPLTTIKTLVHVLQKDNIPSDERDEYLKTIAVECDRQIDFVQTLLDLSRIESGAYKIVLAKTDVASVLQSCIDSQKHAISASGLKLRFDKPAIDLPPAMTDAPALRRIVSSLLENAIKYTSPPGEIRLSARAEKQKIVIEISDTGCGIASEDQPHIFDKFYRGKPFVRENEDAFYDENGCGVLNEASGTGLGLYLVKTLVEQVGGSIVVQSPTGENGSSGTRFTLSFAAYSPAG
jgi:signal transduction histidine kinase